MADKEQNDSERTMEPGELWSQLQNTIHMRSAQDQVLWTIFGIFGAANAILLVALFQNGLAPDDFSWFVISLVGMITSIAWRKLLRRALGNVWRHEALMERLEIQLKIPVELAISSTISKGDYEKYLGRGLKAGNIMLRFSVATAIVWAAALVWSIISLCGLPVQAALL